MAEKHKIPTSIFHIHKKKIGSSNSVEAFWQKYLEVKSRQISYRSLYIGPDLILSPEGFSPRVIKSNPGRYSDRYEICRDLTSLSYANYMLIVCYSLILSLNVTILALLEIYFLKFVVRSMY